MIEETLAEIVENLEAIRKLLEEQARVDRVESTIKEVAKSKESELLDDGINALPRKEIISELHRLGVEFSSKQQTKTLQKMLAKTRNTVARMAEETDNEPDLEATISIAQVSKALKAYAKDNGFEKAKEIVGKFGAEKISQIDPKQFVKLMQELGNE